MFLVQQTSTNPYINIALEEYLLKNFSANFFILYCNEPSIIIGKHQNTLAEINLDFVKRKNLKVVRRLSGGGTVYHDLGNLNYSFIANGSEGNLVDFKRFSQPIIDVLHKLGIEANLGGKNDIRVGEKKISGNAEHLYKNRVLHHGTLLFSSKLDELNESIKVLPNTYTDKAVKSIRSQVANISEFLNKPLTIIEFSKVIVDHINNIFPNCQIYSLTTDDNESIRRLVDTKYSTWEWNYGYSPIYTLNKTIPVGKDELIIHIQVEKGIISQISLRSNSQGKVSLSALEQLLLNCSHDFDEVSVRLEEICMDDYLPNLPFDKFIMSLF